MNFYNCQITKKKQSGSSNLLKKTLDKQLKGSSGATGKSNHVLESAQPSSLKKSLNSVGPKACKLKKPNDFMSDNIKPKTSLLPVKKALILPETKKVVKKVFKHDQTKELVEKIVENTAKTSEQALKFKIPKLVKKPSLKMKPMTSLGSTSKLTVKSPCKSHVKEKTSTATVKSSNMSMSLKKHGNQLLKKSKESPLKKSICKKNLNLGEKLNTSAVKTMATRTVAKIVPFKFKTKFPTMQELNESRKQFNLSLGCLYPYLSLNFLFEHQLNKLKSVPSIDPMLLTQHLSKNNIQPTELSVVSLKKEEHIELCKLMSRSAGRPNIYYQLGLGYDLRENTTRWDMNKLELSPKLAKYMHAIKQGLCPEFESEQDENEFKVELISKLTLSEAYILYCHYLERMNSPFRVIECYPGKQGSNFKILFYIK